MPPAEKMSEWLKRASATFVGGAVAVGLVAIPTFVWLPREFDAINTKLDASVMNSAEASQNSAAVVAALEAMRLSIARSDAEPVNPVFLTIVDGGLSVHDVAPDYIEKFVRLFPESLVMSLYQGNKLVNFSYSDFGEQEWVFIERANFLALQADEQRQIIEILERSGVQFDFQF
ncbi:hypothetical protein [Roseinatronobacter sp.]|uniref:hypothetical protein n=1 Tax=Roseinatronobacter sp. TaxID=1945755 RepID=UPI0025EE50E3|nr:hypothetical protein [Roseibaca sp.]